MAEVVKLVLRLPKDLHGRLTCRAKAENVSLNTKIINLLEGRITVTLFPIGTSNRFLHTSAREVVPPVGLGE